MDTMSLSRREMSLDNKRININFRPIASSCHQNTLQICAWNSALEKAPESTP